MLLALPTDEFEIPNRRSYWGVLSFLLLLPLACSGDDASGATGGTGGALIFNHPDGAAAGASVPPPPPDSAFKKADIGSYALGTPIENLPAGPLSAGQNGSGSGCDVMIGIVRDFKGKNEPGGHPDFEAFSG